jgi:mRNA-degrading endonuclease toxin of MazEF toxin-antitoxin module
MLPPFVAWSLAERVVERGSDTSSAVTTVPKASLGERTGRLSDEDLVSLDQAIVVFLGLA